VIRREPGVGPDAGDGGRDVDDGCVELGTGPAISAVLDGPARYTLAALGLEALMTVLLWLAWSGTASGWRAATRSST